MANHGMRVIMRALDPNSKDESPIFTPENTWKKEEEKVIKELLSNLK